MSTGKSEQEQVLLSTVSGNRGHVIWALYKANLLNDDTLPPERYSVFMEKAFSEWPSDMQEKLRPYGASLIQ